MIFNLNYKLDIIVLSVEHEIVEKLDRLLKVPFHESSETLRTESSIKAL